MTAIPEAFAFAPSLAFATSSRWSPTTIGKMSQTAGTSMTYWRYGRNGGFQGRIESRSRNGMNQDAASVRRAMIV